MPNSCLVPGCTERSRRGGQKVSFHVFPVRDAVRCRRWLRAINHPAVGEDAGVEVLKGKTICSRHFKPEDYDRNLFGMMRDALKRTSVPSVFFPPPAAAAAADADADADAVREDAQAGGGASSRPPAAKRTRLQQVKLVRQEQPPQPQPPPPPPPSASTLPGCIAARTNTPECRRSIHSRCFPAAKLLLFRSESRRDGVTRPDSSAHARFQDVGCQTDPPHSVSVATQSAVSPPAASVETQTERGGTEAAEVDGPRVVGCESMSSLPDPPSPPPSSTPDQSRCVKEEEVERPVTEVKVEPLDLPPPPPPPPPPAVSLATEEPDSLARHDNAKYIVFEGCLRELLDGCPACRGQCEVRRRRRGRGTLVAFSQRCGRCGHSREWQSQPVVGSTPLGDLSLSAATYFTGASFGKLAKIFAAMQLQTFEEDTFRRHTQSFLEPAIVHKWREDQQALFRRLNQQGKVAVCGGMRANSPGYTAKFGCYSLMHIETNSIIDLQLVQSDEIGDDEHMEKEGLRRSLDLLEQGGVDVDYMVTERQPHILSYLTERKITQYTDVWLMEKVDKMWYEEVVCDVVQMSQHNQSSALEAFQGLIQGLAPRTVGLPFIGLLCRLYLAIMHYNENAERMLTGMSGQAVIKTDPTYNYIDALLRLVSEEVAEDPTPFVDQLKSIPVPPPDPDPVPETPPGRGGGGPGT